MSRSSGRSAVAAAAYRMGTSLRDEAADRLHDYTRRSGVLRSYGLAPEDAPDWAFQPQPLWNAAEARETRRNSVVARECELALPAAVGARERDDIARAFAQELVDRYGVAVTVAIHEPPREGNGLNHHAHIMWTTRVMGPDGLGEKTRILDDIKNTGPAEIHYLRQFAADLINEALERAGVEERVDARSFKDRGIDRDPTEHLGPTATEIEREGKDSERGDRNREIEERNERLDQLVQELAEVEAEIAAEEERGLDERYGEAGEPEPDTAPEQPAAAAPPEDLEQADRYAAFEAHLQPAIESVEQTGTTSGGSPGWWENVRAALAHYRDAFVDAVRGVRDTWRAWRDPDNDPDLSR